MKGKRKLLQILMDHAPLSGSVTLLELAGSTRLLIENHKGISVYGKEMICVKTSYGQLCIQGHAMELAQMSKSQLVITGKIRCITTEEGR